MSQRDPVLYEVSSLFQEEFDLYLVTVTVKTLSCLNLRFNLLL